MSTEEKDSVSTADVEKSTESTQETEKGKPQKYKKETTSAFLSFLSEVPNFVAVAVTAILTGSISMYMDLLNSTCNVFRAGYITFIAKKLQKNLKFTYNYGIDKLETLAMLFCDALLILGTLCITVCAVIQLFTPAEISDLIYIALILKIINVLADVVLLAMQYNTKKTSKTKVANGMFEAMLGSFLFDFAVMLSVMCSFIFNGEKFCLYVEPVASIIIAACIIVRAAKRIRISVRELTDKSLEENEQIIILRELNGHVREYDGLRAVKSHRSGDMVYVDLSVTFSDETTYADIMRFTSGITEDLVRVFGKCRVSVVISNRK